MPEGSVAALEFYPLAQGHQPGLAPGALQPGSGLPIWRDMLNLRTHEGQLRFREPVIPGALGTPPYSLNDASNVALPLWVGEIPLWVAGSGSRFLVITTLDWWIVNGGVWHNITPEHTTGTVATAGTAVTGTATAWQTRGIKAGDLFEAPIGAGNWRQISTVGSETTLTLATSIGVILAGTTYRIRRSTASVASNVGSHWRHAHVRVLNGGIYVAAMVAGGRTVTATNVPDGAVVVIAGGANLSSTSFTGASVAFLTSGSRAVESGVDNQGFNFEPLGLEVLEDGRLVVPCNWVDFVGAVSGDNRVLYSSHLNLAVWTTSPGNFTDVIQRRSHITGVGRLGRLLTLHFTDQIRLCEPTGQDDPPLAFTQTSATVGAAGPNLVQQSSIGELFVGPDRHLYRFDGASAEALQGASFWSLLAGYQARDLRSAIAVVDEHRGEYSLFIGDVGFTGTTLHSRTVELRYNFRNGQVTKNSYPFHVHAVSDAPLLSDGLPNYTARRSLRQRLFGVASFGNAVASNLVYISSDDPATTQADAVPNVDTLAAEGLFVETDDLDFGAPHAKKTLERVEVWCRGGSFSGPETVECLAFYEGTASSITGQAPTATLATDQEVLYTFYFSADQRAARLWRIRLRAAAGDANFFARAIKMIVHVAPAGDVRAAP